MNAKAYYLTTLGDWRRHAARLANSHWLALDGNSDAAALQDSARILVLVEADEGAHLALESDRAFDPLPHPLAQRKISTSAQAALAQLGVASSATTFDVAEAAVRVHPLLRHRVF